MTIISDLIPKDPIPATIYPEAGKRLLIYVIYDPRGDIEEYVLHALRSLREDVRYIIAVVNGKLTTLGEERLSAVCDRIIQRANEGYDIWGYKTGLEIISSDADYYDEIVIANDTWYGPVGSFREVFERMNSQEIHFWGLTDHPRVEPHPFTQTGYLAYHIQSYWVAVRKEMFLSEDWHNYWRDLPEISTYSDAVVKHEGVFTEHFTNLGYVGSVAFPLILDIAANYPVLYPRQLIQAGCPALKRRAFFQWPAHLDRIGSVGRWTLDEAEARGYPIELIYQDMARNVAPRVMNAGASLVSVLPVEDISYDSSQPMRTLVAAHIFYPEMTDEILSRADNLPGGYDLIITTPDESRATQIRMKVEAYELRGAWEVRIVDSNNGRDQSAFLIGCRDELLSGDYDLVVKVHSKKTPQNQPALGAHFKEQQLDNLLYSPGYVANVVALFQREKGLGLAYPPMVHLGHPTLGHGWWENKPAFSEVCSRLGIRVPLDEVSPLAPYGSMYFARPDALRLMIEHDWEYEDFGGADQYRDGGLAHVLERLPSYAAGELRFHTRTIATPEYMAMSYSAMLFNLDQISATIPGSTMDQIQFLREVGDWGAGSRSDIVRMFLRKNHPSLLVRFERSIERLRGVTRRGKQSGRV